jgi:hypothetical protein
VHARRRGRRGLTAPRAPCPARIRGNGEVIKREEFEQRKAAAEAAREARLNQRPKKLISQGKDLEGCPLLQARRRWGAGDGLLCARMQSSRVFSDVCKSASSAPQTTSAAAGCPNAGPQPRLRRAPPPPPQALSDREEAVRNGKLVTIVFIRDRNARGQEVGGRAQGQERERERARRPCASRDSTRVRCKWRAGTRAYNPLTCL